MKTLWQPSQSFIDHSNISDYQKYVAETYDLTFANYEDLWAWSISEIDDFWESVWKYFGVISHRPYEQVIGSQKMPGTTWFRGSTLNYAEHLFRYENSDRPALIFASEREEIHPKSWADLRHEVAAFRDHLVATGVRQGDRVAAYLPNIPATVAAFMATNSLGAVWSCCSMDFGEHTVTERFEQIQPKVFISANGYYYKSKIFDRTKEIQHIAASLPSIQAKILIDHLAIGSKIKGWALWDDILSAPNPKELQFRPVPFDHPIWILYSSGTTGKPKAITHSHGGVLLEHLKYLSFHNDVKEGENFFWFSTTGWMMWNFLQASLLVGATPILYEGSPAHPDIHVLWRLVEKLPIHHFGISAPYLTALMNLDLNIQSEHRLSALRSVGSTGAPLPPDVFEYIYKKISDHIWLCSMSGGTDVCTAFVGGVPEKPVIKGRIQGRALGTALYAYSDAGKPVQNELGEMVIEKPMPSMPIYFWGDSAMTRYHSSYFDHFPGKWRHGDYIKIFDDGSLIIQGRSDATLNRKGVRIGTAEIYNVLNEFPEISDALVLNLEQEYGDLMPLFLVLENSQQLTKELQVRVAQKLRSECSPRHVPDVILSIPDIPYTLSGKKMEVPVKKLFMGITTAESVNKDAIRNPEAMEYLIDNVDRLLVLIQDHEDLARNQ